MAAGDVVGENFKLGLGGERGVVGEQQAPAHHLAIGFLRMRGNHDLALKNAVGVIVQHIFEGLATPAIRRVVAHHQRDVGVVVAAENRRARELQLRARARQRDKNLPAQERRLRQQGHRAQLGARRQDDVERLHLHASGFAAAAGMIELRIFTEFDEQGAVAEAGESFVAGFHDFRASARAEADEVAAEAAAVGFRAGQRDDFDDLFDARACKNVEQETAARKGGVEVDQRIGGAAEKLPLAGRRDLDAGKRGKVVGKFWREETIDGDDA